MTDRCGSMTGCCWPTAAPGSALRPLGTPLEVAIGTGLNLPLYPAAVGLPATLGVVSRQTAYDPTITRPLLEACVATCKSCGDECARHAPLPALRACEQACRRCEQACRELLAVLK
jgi:hypothetical protein